MTTFVLLVLVIQFLITLIYSQSLFVTIVFRNLIQDGDEILLSMTKVPSDDILESLYKLRIRESEQLKTILEIHQKVSMPNVRH